MPMVLKAAQGPAGTAPWDCSVTQRGRREQPDAPHHLLYKGALCSKGCFFIHHGKEHPAALHAPGAA